MGSGQQTGKNDTPVFAGVGHRNVSGFTYSVLPSPSQSADQTIYLPTDIGAQDKILSIDAAGNTKWVTASVASTDASVNWNMYEEFLGTVTTFQNGWTATQTGTGAAVTQDTASVGNNSFGVCSLSTGTTTTGICALQLGAGTVQLGASELHFSSRSKVTTLFSGAQRFIRRVGLMDVVNTIPANGIWFEDDGLTSVNWQLVCKSVGVETRIVTADTITTAWDQLRFDVNSAGTSVTFYINGVNLGTITTNIPTANRVSVGLSMIKSAGTTARIASFDYVTAWGTFAAAR